MSELNAEYVCGFTGTRKGMTPTQATVVDAFTAWDFSEIHHGDCVGADYDMHMIALANEKRIVVHPPTDGRLRSYCDGDVVLPEKPYLDRNRDIVDACGTLVATPAEMTEQSKGGTWYTIRYARQQGKRVVIVWPDGTVHTDGSGPHQGDTESMLNGDTGGPE